METPVFTKRKPIQENTEVRRMAGMDNNSGIDESKFEKPEIKFNSPPKPESDLVQDPIEAKIPDIDLTSSDPIEEVTNSRRRHKRHRKKSNRKHREAKQVETKELQSNPPSNKDISIKERRHDLFIFGDEFKNMEDEILNKIMDNVGSNNSDIAKDTEAKRVFGIHSLGGNRNSPYAGYNSVSSDDNYRKVDNILNTESSKVESAPQQIEETQAPIAPIEESQAKKPQNNNHYTLIDDNLPMASTNMPSSSTQFKTASPQESHTSTPTPPAQNKPQKTFDFQLPKGFIKPKSEGTQAASGYAPHYTLI